MSDFGGEQNAGGGNPSAPAGWYPVDGGQQRYWDGAQWTEHTAPLPPTDAPQPGGPDPGSAADPFGAPAGAGYEPMPFGAPAPAGAITSDDRTMALLAHLLAIFVGFFGPLIIWLIKKDQSPFVDEHGKEALNFQISMFIYWIVAFISLLVLIGLVLIPILFLMQIILPIMAAVAANRGDSYRYPLTIRLIR
jgi:uncharacterized Tic20 family protein